jgi:hypothetical protein
MKRKLEIHLLPHFGHIMVSELTSRDVEAYLDRKLAENRRIEAALAICEPLVDGRGRAMQPLRPQTINSHLHLLSEILARAVREGLLARNPAEGEDLRLEVRREKKYGLELDEAMSLVDAAGKLDQRPGPKDELRRRIVSMRATGKAWKAIAADSTSPNQPPSTTQSAPTSGQCRATAQSSRPSRSRASASASYGAQLRARRPRPSRASRARRQDAGRSAPRRHPRRPPGRARRVQGSAR